VYLDDEKKQYNVKRFKIETTTLHNKFFFIKEGKGNILEGVTTDPEPVLAVQQGRGAQVRRAKFKLEKVVEVMGWKAVGARLVDFTKSTEMQWVRKKEINSRSCLNDLDLIPDHPFFGRYFELSFLTSWQWTFD
jgi:topoisomerase-4 subunit A